MDPRKILGSQLKMLNMPHGWGHTFMRCIQMQSDHKLFQVAPGNGVNVLTKKSHLDCDSAIAGSFHQLSNPITITMFTLVRPLIDDEIPRIYQYYHTVHGKTFSIPPEQFEISKIYLDHLRALQEPFSKDNSYRLNAAAHAFNRQRRTTLETGHFVIGSVADSLTPNPSPAFLVGLLRSNDAPLLICAISQSNNNYVLWLATISPFCTTFASPLWT